MCGGHSSWLSWVCGQLYIVQGSKEKFSVTQLWLHFTGFAGEHSGVRRRQRRGRPRAAAAARDQIDSAALGAAGALRGAGVHAGAHPTRGRMDGRRSTVQGKQILPHITLRNPELGGIGTLDWHSKSVKAGRQPCLEGNTPYLGDVLKPRAE